MGSVEASRQPIVLRPGEKIGNADAELDDAYLFDCFVRHPAYDGCSNVSSPAMILAGRTGSGKTAILRYIEHEADQVHVIDPTQLSLNYVSNSDIITFLSRIGADLDLLFQVLWKHVLCIELIRLIYEVHDEPESKTAFARMTERFRNDARKKRALNYLRSWEGKFWITMDQNIKEITAKVEKQIEACLGADFNKIMSRARYDKQISEEKKSDLVFRTRNIVNPDQMAELSCVIEIINDKIFDKKGVNYFLLIDKLDERWIDDSIRFRLIRALIESLKTFRRIENLKVIVALRSDVLERVVQETKDPGFQREKFEDYFVNLLWKGDQIRDLVEKRISKMFRNKYASRAQIQFSDIFRNKVGNLDAFQYIIDRTLMRPRDIIAFINECLELAQGRFEVTASCIREAERNYSRKRREALENEWQGAFPSLPLLLDFVASKRKTTIRFAELLDDDKLVNLAINILALEKDGQERDAACLAAYEVYECNVSCERLLREAIPILYRVGAISVKLHVSDRYICSYQDQPIIGVGEIQSEGSVKVHPMLHHALGVGEKYKRSSRHG